MHKRKISDSEIREQAGLRMYPHLANRSLARKLAAEECVDISTIGKVVEGTERNPTLLELSEFDASDNVDYAYLPTEQLVGSVGKHVKTGVIFAAFDARFYKHHEYECLFLR